MSKVWIRKLIINNSRKFVFIHIPKSAGTTVTSYFAEFSTCRDIEIGGTLLGEQLQPYFLQRYGLGKHSTITEADQAMSGTLKDNFFSFSFVRNPYERVISSFKFLRLWSGWSGHSMLENIVNVNDFIQSDFFQTDGPDRILKPQTFWITKPSDSRNIITNYVGRVETLDVSINKLSKKLGLPRNDRKLDRKNNSDSREDGKRLNLVLSAKSIDIINRRYSIDFDLLGYEFRSPY